MRTRFVCTALLLITSSAAAAPYCFSTNTPGANTRGFSVRSEIYKAFQAEVAESPTKTLPIIPGSKAPVNGTSKEERLRTAFDIRSSSKPLIIAVGRFGDPYGGGTPIVTLKKLDYPSSYTEFGENEVNVGVHLCWVTDRLSTTSN